MEKKQQKIREHVEEYGADNSRFLSGSVRGAWKLEASSTFQFRLTFAIALLERKLIRGNRNNDER